MSKENSSPSQRALKNQSRSNSIVPAASTRTHFLGDLLSPENDDSLRDISKVIERFKICHDLCTSSIRQSLRHAVDCGRIAEMLRAYFGHGCWTKYFEEELRPKLGVSLRTIERYINVYRQFQQFASQSGHSLNSDDEDLHTEKLLAEFQIERQSEPKQKSNSPNEWRTPSELLSIVRSFFQDIDCDPCNAPLDNADQCGVSLFYSIEDGTEGGLSEELPWSGRCWVAPGHKGDLSPWVRKGVRELARGEMKEALLLLPCRSLSCGDLLSFPFVALKQPIVVSIQGKKGMKQHAITDRMMIHYLATTPDVERFVRFFSPLGSVFTRYEVEFQGLEAIGTSTK